MYQREEFFAHEAPPWYVESEQGAGLPPGEAADEDDICRFVNETCWKNWMPSYRSWHRQVEENVRMISGRQYDVFIESVGEFIDLSNWFLSADERWRQFPVFNWLAHYYKLTESKLTENTPAIGWLPSSADWRDAVTAQAMEPIWKYEWLQMGMPEAAFALYGWVIVAARSITKLRWDPDRGPLEEFRGDALIEMIGQGGALTQRLLTNAPYVRNTEGLFVPHVLRSEDDEPLTDESGTPLLGDPYTSRAGDLAFDVLTPTSVVTPTGPDPFHEKPWYTHEYLMPVEEIERRFGIEVEPDDITADDDLNIKLAFGQNYGMPSGFVTNLSVGSVEGEALKGYKRIKEHWRREIPNHPTQSRGRLIIVTEDQVLYDDINPFWVQGSQEQTVMPFDAWDAVPVPWRNEGVSDLEILNPVQRALNRRLAAVMDTVDYNEQPATFYNENVVDDEDVDHINRPGAWIKANLSPGVGEPAWRLPAADLPRGSVDLANLLQNWMQLLGSQPFGSEGLPVTSDASGELQREVRFDTDRVWGATIRLHSYGWARVAMKMGKILSACITDDRMLVMSGEDQAPEFIAVGPQIFEGRAHTYPLPESQVLESRQEKQNRIASLIQMGLPVEQGLKALNYPDINRVLRPGGPAYAMAQRENLEMMLGQPSPVLQEHDHAVHLLVLVNHMQTPAYRDADPAIQALFRLHKFLHEQYQAAEMLRQGLLAGQVSGTLQAQQAGADAVSAAIGEPAEATGGGEGKPPSGSSGSGRPASGLRLAQ